MTASGPKPQIDYEFLEVSSHVPRRTYDHHPCISHCCRCKTDFIHAFRIRLDRGSQTLREGYIGLQKRSGPSRDVTWLCCYLRLDAALLADIYVDAPSGNQSLITQHQFHSGSGLTESAPHELRHTSRVGRPGELYTPAPCHVNTLSRFATCRRTGAAASEVGKSNRKTGRAST